MPLGCEQNVKKSEGGDQQGKQWLVEVNEMGAKVISASILSFPILLIVGHNKIKAVWNAEPMHERQLPWRVT